MMIMIIWIISLVDAVVLQCKPKAQKSRGLLRPALLRLRLKPLAEATRAEWIDLHGS